jgi:hypothetical protein
MSSQPINRRSFVGRVAGGLAAAGGAFGLLQARARADPPGASHPPSPQDSDQDSDDPSGLGRTIGRDASDPTRRLARPTVGRRPDALQRVPNRCSDRDPNDPGGHGRHCGPFVLHGGSDHDPTDPPGGGRGG